MLIYLGKPIALGIILMLAACATTPEANLYLACKSVSETEMALRSFKAKMSADQTNAVKQVLMVAQPICKKPAGETVNAREATRRVRDELARLLQIQNEVKR